MNLTTASDIRLQTCPLTLKCREPHDAAAEGGGYRYPMPDTKDARWTRWTERTRWTWSPRWAGTACIKINQQARNAAAGPGRCGSGMTPVPMPRQQLAPDLPLCLCTSISHEAWYAPPSTAAYMHYPTIASGILWLSISHLRQFVEVPKNGKLLGLIGTSLLQLTCRGVNCGLVLILIWDWLASIILERLLCVCVCVCVCVCLCACITTNYVPGRETRCISLIYL